MKVLTHTEGARVITLIVRRWRWLWPVTETWIASSLTDYSHMRCHKYFDLSHSFEQHRRWYDTHGRVASCRLAVRLDAACVQETEYRQLRAATAKRQHDDATVVSLEERRARKTWEIN